MIKTIFDNKTLAIIIILQIILIFLFGILFAHDSFYLNADDTFLFIFYILVIGTLGSFFLALRKSVPIRWKTLLWIKEFFKSLDQPLWIIWIILLSIFITVLLGKIILLHKTAYSWSIGIVGSIASISAFIYALYINRKFDKKFDYRVKFLAHDECFSKLSTLLTKEVNGLGLPPEELISIANRNSLIPAFWVDPLEYRGIEWRAFIVALHKKMQNNKIIKLDLHLPLPCHPDTDADADEYFKVMENLAKLSAENILSHLKDDSITERTQNSRYLIAIKKLPTCYNTPLRLIRTNDAGIYNTDSRPYYTAAINTLPNIKKPCLSCENEGYCFNKKNLKHSLLIIYCNYVVELFENINEYSNRISIQNNSVDKGIHFPLLIFFDQKTWSRERTKVLMTVMHEGVIETGEFTSQLLFPWEMVKGLRETISHTNDSSKKDNRSVTQKLDSIINAHREKRIYYDELLVLEKRK